MTALKQKQAELEKELKEAKGDQKQLSPQQIIKEIEELLQGLQAKNQRRKQSKQTRK